MFRFLTALLLSTLLATAHAAAPPREGVDFAAIEGGRPYATPPGVVEVAEVFGYTCPACARFEAPLAGFKRTLPKGARFVAVPAALGGHWLPYARAYFAAQALGVAERSHAAMFRALHEDGTLPMSRPSAEELAGFYTAFGVPPARFVQAFNARTVDAQIDRTREWLMGTGLTGTPTLVVAGKWRVAVGSPEQMLRTARWLVDRELAQGAR